ncbi:hypothetical protein ACIOD2_13525 [Amycolatopsis sp. NPDC088138]|uniref:hypothetical protein n=1 Tax=Amycolatopsis sp. NPDC088138 TaxID=3363938 RepID=UPI0037F68F8E
MDLNPWVVRDGVLVRAAGRVLVIDGETWFERPPWRAMPMTRPRRAPRPGAHALRVHGVDVDRLDRLDEYPGGVVEGWATLTATWRHGELHTQAQEPMSTSAPDAEAGRWTSPPCPPPVGGWPVVPLVGPTTAANLTASPPPQDRWAELTITQITQFRPHPAQPVLVVAAEDPERAERALRPTFGASLCVVGSRYRQRDIDAAQDRLRQELPARRWRLTSTGRSAGDDGQPTVTAEFAWIEAEVARWATTVPDGLLDADVWLTPIAASSR